MSVPRQTGPAWERNLTDTHLGLDLTGGLTVPACFLTPLSGGGAEGLQSPDAFTPQSGAPLRGRPASNSGFCRPTPVGMENTKEKEFSRRTLHPLPYQKFRTLYGIFEATRRERETVANSGNDGPEGRPGNLSSCGSSSSPTPRFPRRRVGQGKRTPSSVLLGAGPHECETHGGAELERDAAP